MEYKQETSTIKSWAEDDRPREKLMIKGRSYLSDAELLAIVLGSGTRQKTAVELAQEILISCDENLYTLGQYDQSDLMKFKGVGTAKAITIMAVLELGRRRAATPIPNRGKLNKAKDAYNHMKHKFENLQHEEFHIIGLSRNNQFIGERLISKGGRTGTIADGKIIFKELLNMKASACLLFHNHPSGNLTPSSTDITLTKKLVEFGRLIDMPILDHLIITDNGFYSFAENGRM